MAVSLSLRPGSHGSRGSHDSCSIVPRPGVAAPGRSQGQSRGSSSLRLQVPCPSPLVVQPSGGSAGEIPTVCAHNRPRSSPSLLQRHRGSGCCAWRPFPLPFYNFISFCQTLSVLEPRVSRPALGRSNEVTAPLHNVFGVPTPLPARTRGKQRPHSPVGKAGAAQPCAAWVFSRGAGRAEKQGSTFLRPQTSFSAQLGGEFIQCPAPPSRPGRPSAALPPQGHPSRGDPASEPGCGTRAAAAA